MKNKNGRKKKPREKKLVLFILFCTVIPVLHFAVFYIYTNFSAFTMAFMDKNGTISLDNFVRFFKEFSLPTSTIRIAFRNTFLTFGIGLLTFPFKVLVSYFIYKKVPGHKVFRILFFIPTIVFSVAVSMVFTRLVSVDGAIAQWIGETLNLGYTPDLLGDSRFANITVLANLLWLSFPGDLIIWGGTFARIPEEVLESAKIDGASWWTEFTRITVPLVWPTVALQMVLTFSAVFSASGNVFLLTGGEYDTMTLNAWMYLELYNSSGNQYTSNVYNYLSAVGLMLTVVAVTISLLVRKYTDKAFNDVEF